MSNNDPGVESKKGYWHGFADGAQLVMVTINLAGIGIFFSANSALSRARESYLDSLRSRSPDLSTQSTPLSELTFPTKNIDSSHDEVKVKGPIVDQTRADKSIVEPPVVEYGKIRVIKPQQ